MKRRSQIPRLHSGQVFLGLRAILLAAVVILVSLSGSAYCQTEGVSLLLQQIPAQGGTITPSVDVHNLKPNSEITLTANPKPGYQFVHWLGEVSDPTASKTVVYLNTPKVIIAVFEQTEDGDSMEKESLSAGGGGAFGSSLSPTAVDLSRPGGLSAGGGGGSVKPQPRTVIYVLDDEKTPEVPEPATGVLLVLGGLFAIARRGARRLAS